MGLRGCYEDIYVLYLLCYVKGVCELREGLLGVRWCYIYGRDSVIIFDMGSICGLDLIVFYMGEGHI